ncbi:MAG: ABC transporter permease [Anaerolineales bacterium]|nr:ABC transporter permease [Anaerolineales bacterium]
MNKTLLIIKKEFITTVTRRSFLFAAFGMPLIGALLLAVVSMLNQNSSDALENIIGSPEPAGATTKSGYIDQAGLIQEIPGDVPADAFVAYTDSEVAKQALLDGEIGAYYIIPADYVETGDLILVQEDFNPITSSDQANTQQMRWLIRVNLLGGDTALAAKTSNPAYITATTLAPADQQRDSDNPLTFAVPYATTIAFYVVILGSSSLLLNSVTKEKENRVIEILMVSVNSRQLLTGKVVGLGIAGLIQTAIWVGTGYTILRLSGGTLDFPTGYDLPVSFLVWGVVFFLLGYTVYASLMAGLGALVPSLREASQVTFLIIFPLIIPMFVISILINDPHGTLSTVLSLFPLTAPVTMMTRLSAGGVPFWQPFLAAGLLALTALFVIRAVAGFFDAQTLLSGQAISLKRFLNAMLGRA